MKQPQRDIKATIGLLAAAILLRSTGVDAHPPGLSSINLEIKPAAIEVTVSAAIADLEAFVPMDLDRDAEISNAEREAAKLSIAKAVAENLRLRLDGEALGLSEAGQVIYDDEDNAHALFYFPFKPSAKLHLQSNLLSLLPAGHQQYVSVRDANGNSLQDKLLDKDNTGLDVNLQQTDAERSDAKPPATFQSFADFFALGFEHILLGYDHLLFLFGLLAVTHGFWPAIRIITSFTLAHSITLACAAFNLIELSSELVEPAIAATIIYVGIENLIRGDRVKGRGWLTFGFGLIHGFGFASALREMNISSGNGGIVIPLLSFNLGIESGQIAIAALVLPLIWRLNTQPVLSAKLLKICSIAICLIGTYWLIERVVTL